MCCEALRAAQLGHLLRLVDDYVCGCVNPEELELADPEVATAFRFIASSLKNVSHE